jgi:bisanhydrobacterioruberin hydratase
MLAFIQKYSRVQQATFVVILFHCIGLIGMHAFSWFSYLTPLNLLLSFSLLIYTKHEADNNWYLFFFIAFITGMVVEYLGVNYQVLFGNYYYKPTMGPMLSGTPYIIGVNWFIMTYTSAITTNYILKKFIINTNSLLYFGLHIFLAALFTTLVDVVLEPVAIHLNWWAWRQPIPFYNYACWYIISLCLMVVYNRLQLKPTNIFALTLFIVQSIFFIILKFTI